MTRNSRRMIELDNAIADCHRTIEDLRAQHQRTTELETRLQGLEISRRSIEEKLGRSRERVQELEERYADPTQLPEVKGYVRRELQGSGRKAFFAPKRKCKRSTLISIFLPLGA